MYTIYTHWSVSITEFKKNPIKIIRSSSNKPVAVLNHNKPMFFVLAPELFEALMEELDNKKLVELARQRLSTQNDVVMMDIDKI